MPPTPTPIFPDGSLVRIWDALLLKLQTDPTLKRGVKTWQTFGGDSDDLATIPLDALPALRLTPGVGDFRWADECRYDGPFYIGIEYAVPRKSVRELMNFWQYVAKALRWNTAMQDHFLPLGVYNLVMSTPAIAPRPIASGQGLASEGRITLSINLDA